MKGQATSRTCGWIDCYEPAIKLIDFRQRIFGEYASANGVDLAHPLKQRYLCGSHSEEIRQTYFYVAEIDLATPGLIRSPAN